MVRIKRRIVGGLFLAIKHSCKTQGRFGVMTPLLQQAGLKRKSSKSVIRTQYV
jgi:hypothetical protein